ncbi:transmembrane and coiled-coil domains protein 2 isoform X3 [Zootermopsis nevadensis]|uniref:transmembrane and coiled-coil domains protein 2 isoform X3 n=1 Tax=Zootermopsis nevadensis TaxID=136037 RepID=UPI000B8EB6F6|nr:transmembrane and coiled-coil domains protein 2 isoform X3 [Zootermopsis nevadensis]
MDSLHVVPSGSSKSTSRSASPGRPLPSSPSSHILVTSSTSSPQNASVRRSGDGSNGSGSSSTMSGSVKNRHKSPIPVRRERGDKEKGSSDGGTPHLPRPEPVSNQGSQEEGTSQSAGTEEEDIFLPLSSHLSNGSSEQVTSNLLVDEVDGHLTGSSDILRTRAAIEHMQSKIGRTRDLIRGEQTTRDDNVNEYLKLSANADKQQLQRIKAVFEKKNQKSAQSISQLQKKLESYNKKLRDLEVYGLPSSHRQPREMLRDMGQGLKTVMSKPREFAHLIKNKFGSADNINTLTRNGDNGSVDEEKTHHGSATLPGGCSLGSTHASSSAGVIKFASEEGSECSSVTSGSIPAGNITHQFSPNHPATLHLAATYSLEPIFTELQERREEIDRLREELEGVKQALQREVTFMSQALQEERFRSERLEEQVNDLTELHQNEVENLKQTITDMEEKVQYQSEERLRDIHEMLESCQTKISKMEHQQQQHQQYVTLEGIDNSNARALVVKLINVVLTVLQVILLLVATAAGIVMPFLRTRLRVLTTTVLVAGVVFILKQWPEVRDVGSHLIRHLKQALSVK